MLIGYIRAKAGDADDLSKQRRVLQDADCHDIVEDISAAARWNHSELHRLLNRTKRGGMSSLWHGWAPLARRCRTSCA